MKRGGTDAFLTAAVAALVLLRVAAAARLPLFDDEAYYWLWSLRPDWGYLDHPPLIAWLIYVGTRVADSPGWIRAAPQLCGGLTSYVLFLFGRDLFDRRTGLLAALIAAGTLGVAATGMLATPDTPLLLAWVFVARAVWLAVHGRTGWWGLAGAGLGLGLLGKLSILWLAGGLAAYVLTSARDRLRTVGPYAAVAIGAAVAGPFIAWNAGHEWATIRFTLTERPIHMSPGLGAAADLFAAQFIYALLLFPVFAWALWAAWRERGDARFRFLFWSAVPAVALPLAAALVTGTHRSAWMIPAFLMLAVVVAARRPAARSAPGWWSRAAAAATGISLAGVAALGVLVLSPGVPPLPGAESLYGWHDAGRRAASEVLRLPAPAALASDRYQVAAQVAYATRAQIPVILLPSADPASIWVNLWGPSAQWRGRDAIVVVDPLWPEGEWDRYASRVTELPPLIVDLAARPARTFLFYRLAGLRLSTARPDRRYRVGQRLQVQQWLLNVMTASPVTRPKPGTSLTTSESSCLQTQLPLAWPHVIFVPTRPQS